MFIPVLIGVIFQVAARQLFDATPAEGFITYLLGFISGHTIVNKKGDAK